MDNLSEMAVFAKVVEHRGFTAAATALGVSKSAVSKQVGRLVGLGFQFFIADLLTRGSHYIGYRVWIVLWNQCTLSVHQYPCDKKGF